MELFCRIPPEWSTYIFHFYNEIILKYEYHLYRIKVLQNGFLRASLFRKRDCSINVLYFTFGVLKFNDLIDMKHAKFLFRFNNSMLPDYFKNDFVKLDILVKKKKKIFHTFASTEW